MKGISAHIHNKQIFFTKRTLTFYNSRGPDMLSEVGQQYHKNNVKHISDGILLLRSLIGVHYNKPCTLYCCVFWHYQDHNLPQLSSYGNSWQIWFTLVDHKHCSHVVHKCHPMLLISNLPGDHLSICCHGWITHNNKFFSWLRIWKIIVLCNHFLTIS